MGSCRGEMRQIRKFEFLGPAGKVGPFDYVGIGKNFICEKKM